MKTDVAILGGGPGGSAAAMFLVREGIKPLIIESETFPRFHIGESFTGDAERLIRDLGLGERMDQRGWPRKQGVKVYGTNGKNSWFVPVTGRDAEWKLQPRHTWHTRRSEFDKMMLDEAIARGASLLPAKATRPLVNDDGSVRGVEVRLNDGGITNVESEILLDCSGQATFLANHGATGPKYLGNYDKQIAIFSQVTDVIREDDGTREGCRDNTLILYQGKYHWAWFIPIGEDAVSVGVVVPSAYFLGKKESKRDFLVRELNELNPELKRRIPEVKLVEDIHVIPNYSYQVRRFCGKGYICIGDAHRFIDPIFSFGVTVALAEAKFAAPLVKAYLNGERRDKANPFADYQAFIEKGIDVLEDGIDMFWEKPLAFAFCVHAKHKDVMTDMFAGRIFERQPSPAVLEFRKALGRERIYGEEDIYSIPIGSRYHPERAPLWEANSEVDTTEEWLGPR